MERMVKKNTVSILISILLISSLIWLVPVSAKQPEWFLKLQTIKVFQSSKEDVERIFDYPKTIYSSNKDGKESGWGEIIEYQTNAGKLEVFYSTGKCSEITNNDGWDVEEGIVVSIEFEPHKPVKLSEVGLDLQTFKGYKESDTQYFHYNSETLGIEFTLLGGKVTSIEYSLTPAMQELDCEKVLKNR